jgi:putative intracellular protease/amidase
MTATADALISDATKRIADFDMSVVPGGMPSLLQGFASEKKPDYQFMKDFVELQQRGAKEKVLLSVYTGALLVVAAGVFGGLKATTHHMFYDLLEEIDGDIDVVDCLNGGGTRRYVYGGLKKDGSRVVTCFGWGAEGGTGSCGVCCEDNWRRI